jgi:hypothetical protein
MTAGPGMGRAQGIEGQSMKTMKAYLAGATALAGIMAVSPAFAQDLPSREELWKMIQQQQAQIEALQQKIDVTEKKVQETDKKVEATGSEVERIASSGGGSGGDGWWQRTSVGGYGEVHYNGGDTDEVDIHRFVLFINHEFNDKVRFFSELEVEHGVAGEGQNGEVEVEQAFVEVDVAEHHSVTAGLQLVPVGILNITHEPPTFYGVERNNVEVNIIPTTWWEAGVGAHGELGSGFAYSAFVHSGLRVPTTGANAFRIRSGRQKVSEAKAKDGAVTTQLTYSGIPGVQFGVTGQYQSDLTQGEGEKTSATLFEAHVDSNFAFGPGSIGFRALAARWDLDSNAAEAIGRDEQYGWYIEPSYRFPVWYGDLGFFARYSEWDNAAGGGADSKFSQTQIGANYWPVEDVVFKLDYQFDDAPVGGTEDDRLNVGVGFQF